MNPSESNRIDRTNFTFQLGDIGVSVTSEYAPLLDDLVRVYGACRQPACPEDHMIHIVVRRAESSRPWRRRYVVFGDGEPIGGERPAGELFPFVEWGVNWRVVARRDDVLQIHAATLSRWGSGVVLAGAPESGKSTLAAGLLAGGWSYLSDEFALIDPETLRAQPFPKAICVKSGSFDIVQKLGLPFARRRGYVKGAKGRVGYINPVDVAPDAVGEACPIRYVIFPRYTGAKHVRLVPISRSRAALELLRNAFNRRAFPDEGVSIAAAVVNGAECYALDTGDVADAVTAMASLASSPERNVAGHQPDPAPDSPQADAFRPLDVPRGLKPAARDTIPPAARDVLPSRRRFLGRAAKVAYTAPVIAALLPQTAYAAASIMSCYPLGHACPGAEPCCGDLECKSGVCAGPCQDPGELCFLDSDCCSGDCDLGVCN